MSIPPQPLPSPEHAIAWVADRVRRGGHPVPGEDVRKFYLTYRDREPQIAQTVSAQLPMLPSDQPPAELEAAEKTQTSSAYFTLSWSHCVFLISVQNPDERSFYEIEA